MSINKDKVKVGIKNQLKTILHMLIFNIITIVIIYIAYSDKKWLGTWRSAGFLSMREWSINVYIYAICMLIFIVGYIIFWRKFLKKDLKKDIETHWGCVVTFTILFLLFLFVQFLIIATVVILQIGLFDVVINVPEFVLECMVLIIYPVVDFIVDIIMKKIKITKKIKEE